MRPLACSYIFAYNCALVVGCRLFVAVFVAYFVKIRLKIAYFVNSTLQNEEKRLFLAEIFAYIKKKQ